MQLGQRPAPEEWYARFPQWRHDLEQLFEVHHLARAGTDSESAATLRDRGQRAAGPSLLGMPVLGHLTAVKSGHSLNHKLVSKVLAEAEACEIVQPSAADELHEMQERLLPVMGMEEQVA